MITGVNALMIVHQLIRGGCVFIYIDLYALCVHGGGIEESVLAETVNNVFVTMPSCCTVYNSCNFWCLWF